MSTTKLASRGWYHAMGKAIEQLHQDSFPHALIEVFHRAFTFNFAMIMIFPVDSIPTLVYEDTVSGLMKDKERLENYFDGIYLLDPLYQVATQHPNAGLYSLKEVTSDDFSRSGGSRHVDA